MEEKAKMLRKEIDILCGKFYYEKDGNVIQRALAMAQQVEEYCSFFLQGNVFGMEDTEYDELSRYVVGVLEDFVAAVQQEDTVLMLDTLDYGLRELLDIMADGAEAEPEAAGGGEETA